MAVPIDTEKFTLTKLEAGRRQLHAAIRLWFSDEDPVAILALAFAAHEIVHGVFKARGFKGLLFDAVSIQKANRQKFSHGFSKVAGFLKHARNDPFCTIEFNPSTSEPLMIAAACGLRHMGEPVAMEESALVHWLLINRPEMINVEAVAAFLPTDGMEEVRAVSRGDFLRTFDQFWRDGWFRLD